MRGRSQQRGRGKNLLSHVDGPASYISPLSQPLTHRALFFDRFQQIGYIGLPLLGTRDSVEGGPRMLLLLSRVANFFFAGGGKTSTPFRSSSPHTHTQGFQRAAQLLVVVVQTASLGHQATQTHKEQGLPPLSFSLPSPVHRRTAGASDWLSQPSNLISPPPSPRVVVIGIVRQTPLSRHLIKPVEALTGPP